MLRVRSLIPLFGPSRRIAWLPAAFLVLACGCSQSAPEDRVAAFSSDHAPQGSMPKNRSADSLRSLSPVFGGEGRVKNRSADSLRTLSPVFGGEGRVKNRSANSLLTLSPVFVGEGRVKNRSADSLRTLSPVFGGEGRVRGSLGTQVGSQSTNGSVKDPDRSRLVIHSDPAPPAPGTLRIATYNAAMYRSQSGELARELAKGDSQQARGVAEVVQRVQPDVLLVNEIDDDPQGQVAELFWQNFLEQPLEGLSPCHFVEYFTAPVNTGVPSGHDLDQDGQTDGPGDGFGYGAYPGEYGMVVYSRLPIDRARARTFQKFVWYAMPDAVLPQDPGTGRAYYSDNILSVMRLSSKSHWDVPLTWQGRSLHFLVSHPTPPVFDGEEDRNGRRNHDEIRFWADYVDPQRSGYLEDDQGTCGGLPEGARFVIAGDLNADPQDGQTYGGAIEQLLNHPRIASSFRPASAGGLDAARRQGQANDAHKGPPEADTGDFADEAVGNLRLDYVLPSRDLQIVGGGVYWPLPDEPGARAASQSDHHLVWIDVTLPSSASTP